MRPRYTFVAVALLAFSVSHQARADWQLNAESEVEDKPWEKPATINYVRTDNQSSTTIDAVLNYRDQSLSKVLGPGDKDTAKKQGFKFGAYLHRDNTGDAKRNDRGVQIAFSQVFVPGTASQTDAAGAVYSWNWTAKAQLGKSLQNAKDAAGNGVTWDKNKDREAILLAGYYQPAFGHAVPPPGARPDPVYFFEGATGLYSDNSSGGTGNNGRLSGVLAKVGANFAPLGIDPESNRVGSLGVVPTLYATAQIQRDLADSGSRTKDSYRLYAVGASISFGKLGKGYKGVVPSLSLERSTGADLLAGRPRTGRTELSLGLTF